MQEAFDSLVSKLKRKEEEKLQLEKRKKHNEVESDDEFEEADHRPIPEQQIQRPLARTRQQTNRKPNKKTNDPIFGMLKLPFIAAMVGSPKSGKSFCTKHLLVNLLMQGELEFGMVITGTKFNGAFDFILDQNLVVSGFNEPILKQFLRKLKMYREQNGKPAKAFLILDDMVGQIPWESGLILHLLTNYRHYGITVFIATQYIYKINPTARTVCDYAFIWAQDNKRCYDAIYESFGLGFEDFKTFKSTIDSIVEEQYACLLYSKEKRKVDDRYQGYRAPAEIPDVRFRFGKQQQS